MQLAAMAKEIEFALKEDRVDNLLQKRVAMQEEFIEVKKALQEAL